MLTGENQHLRECIAVALWRVNLQSGEPSWFEQADAVLDALDALRAEHAESVR